MIEVKDITKTYKSGDVETQVLKGATFSIKNGEFVAIIGPSGSGKSTLMHVLGLLDRPTSGLYELARQDVTKLSDEELARARNQKLGFVFQTFNLLPRTSVLENVKLPLLYSQRLLAEHDDLARRALAAVGLEHRLEHLSNQLSGGEKQRMAIARALVNDPKIIFADEPTGNLDSKSGGQVMDTLSLLHQKGHTIILVTHETYTAEYAERIIRLKDGAIVSDERVQQRKTIADGFQK